MLISMAAAMAMSMAAPDKAQAEKCASHYTFMSMMIVMGSKSDATDAEKNATIERAFSWYTRGDEVLVKSGLKQPDDDIPDNITNQVVAMIGDVTAKKEGMAQDVLKVIISCDKAYGYETLPII